MEKLILDTDILIDFLRQDPEVVGKIKEIKEDHELGTTDINVFELYRGAYKSKNQEKNLASVKGLLNILFLISTSEDSMDVAAKISADLEKKGKMIEIRDLLIGSICLVSSCKLFTGNEKHFKNIEGLKLL